MRLRLPHPFALLLGIVLLASIMTWIVPAGAYERVVDPDSGRALVVAGSYERTASTPLSLMQTIMAVPRGIIAGADVIVTILFVGGAFALLDGTGALSRLVGSLVGRARRPKMVVVLVSVAFATLGALENMHEEIIALIPVLILLSRGLGFGAVTALAMSLGASVIGAAFGPTNPFGAGLALQYAELPAMSMIWVRFAMLAAGLGVWIAWTLSQVDRDDVRDDVEAPVVGKATGRDAMLLGLLLLPFVPYVYGVLKLDWGFNELSALFLVAGYAVGMLAGFGLRETSERFLEGMAGMLAAALFVGVARSISAVLVDGQIMDTILYSLATPLEHVPGFISAGLMVPIHAVLHLAVTSNSGQAVLTMPIMAPLSDLLGFSRDVSVMAYQTGAVLMDVVSPTNGAMLAMLMAAKMPYGRWVRFAVPGLLLVSLVGFAGMAVAYLGG